MDWKTNNDSQNRHRSSKSRRNMVASLSCWLCKTRAKTPAAFEGSMNAEFDYDLTHDQWETLKAIRVPTPKGRALNRFVVADLVALHLAEITDGRPVITRKGRSVLLRGSPRLLDLAA
jgi:hypothetical protein